MKSKEKEYLNEMIQEKDKKGNLVEFQTSKLIEMINSYCLDNGKFDETGLQNFEKKYLVPHIICKNIEVKDYFIHREIYYKNVKLLSNPKIVEFIDLNLDSKTYIIYNIEFIYELIEKFKFNNPVIIINQKEYPFSTLKSNFDSWVNNFQIVNKKIIEYTSYFQKGQIKDEKTDKISFQIKIGSDLTPNFKYYFKYPKPEESFNFISSSLRSEIFSSLLNDKISGLCGPMGIGKSTTLLALSKLKENYCYFNIKSLNDHQDQLLVWKDELLLLEVAYAMRNNYSLKKFDELKKIIQDIYFYWDAIISIIKYFIKAKINIILILDQYKEKFDHDYGYIKSISNILKKDSKKIVSIIISSSINDKDVRNSLIFQWLKEKSDNIFAYKYYNILINISQNITSDKTLSEGKRKMIVDDFKSIPKFYYAIKALKDDELDTYKNLQIEKITVSINEFFEETKGILERIDTLITLRGSFGQNLEKQQFQELLKILPFKYFTFDLTNFTIDFSFPLVKDIFDDFLSDKICCFLKSPISSLKEGTIGDILELNLINDLKQNYFCKFDQVIKVDSIWDLSKIISLGALDASRTILLLQENNEAKYIDFAILSNNDNLILYQCKKALKKVPDSFITRQKIEYNKKDLKEKFLNLFKVSIKKIYLFYVTGITFFKKNNELKSRTWGIDEKENFSSNIKIANAAKSELFYYDVVNRKIYFKNELNYESIDNIIDHANKYSSPVLVESNEELESKMDKIELLEKDEISELSKRIKKIERNCDVQFYTPVQKAYLKNHNKDIFNNNIIGYIKNPKSEDLKFSRMLGLKRCNKNYLLIEKMNKVRKSSCKKDIQEDIAQENEQEDKDRYLVMVKDDGLEEVKSISKDFYNTIDYAYIFEKKILLKDS